MSDKCIYIDANIYLRFFDSSSSKIRSLLQVLTEINNNIFISKQICDEVNRNKLKVALNSFSANYKELGIKKTTLPEHLDVEVERKIAEWNKKRDKIIEQENKLKNEYAKIVADILTMIMKSTDNVSVELDKVFSLAKAPSEEEIKSAKMRKELGNPPGKTGDPLGDQLSWEQFLSEYDNREIWIITNDDDYLSEYDKKLYLNPFLYNELKMKANSNPHPINLFKSLAEGIEHFSKKSNYQIKSLPSPDQLQQIIIEESELHLHSEMHRQMVQSSNIRSIGYEDVTLTLEVEFQNGSVYQYYNVSREVYAELLRSSSKGSYFEQFIRRLGFPCAKVK